MKFDIYGRFRVEVQREGEWWVAYRLESGKRIKLDQFVIPGSFDEGEIGQYLDDLFHEMAGPGQTVQAIQ